MCFLTLLTGGSQCACSYKSACQQPGKQYSRWPCQWHLPYPDDSCRHSCNESPSSPGLANLGMSSVNSRMLPGQPCMRINGIACSLGDRSCTKWRSMLFTGILKWCSELFNLASSARQSYLVIQCWIKSCKNYMLRMNGDTTVNKF